MTEPQIPKQDYMTNLAVLCQEPRAGDAGVFTELVKYGTDSPRVITGL